LLTVRIDLHAHSSRSDGTEPPAGLVRAAVDAGLDVVAITDHDTAAGWDEARAAAEENGIGLVPGMELSTRYGGRSVHLLAFLPDPTWPELAEELARIVAGRTDRLPALLANLAGAGIELSAEQVDAATPAGAVKGRPHVADALVAAGHVTSRDEAFATLLGPGGPGHVRRYAPHTADMIGIVARAGGASVLAHPWGRSSRRALPVQALAELAGAGLTGLEVDHQDHDPEVRRQLRGLAEELGLVPTGSSDWHGTGKVDHDLGCNTTTPEAYERLLDAARRASVASGRRTPQVVGR
jgi:3',5'-nucleoside bisphosphate phosphatase